MKRQPGRHKALVLALITALASTQAGAALAQVVVLPMASTVAVPGAPLWAAQVARTPGPPLTGQASSLTVTINSGGVQTLGSLRDNQVNMFPTPVRITTQWNLTSVVGVVNLVAYFSSPAAALANGANLLPASRMQGRVATGSPRAFTAFTQNGQAGIGNPGASLTLFRQLVVSPFNNVAQRIDDLELQLDLRGLPALTPGTYAGTLFIRAVTQ